MAKALSISSLKCTLLSFMSGVLTLALPSLPAIADAGYDVSKTTVITPSSSSQVIQPPAGSASPNSGLPAPSSSSGSSSNDAPKATGLDANPIQPRPDVQSRPAFKPRL